MKALKGKIEKSIENKIPFVLYKIPDETKVKSVFQEDSSVYYSLDFLEKGFVFAPFRNIDKSLIIPFDNASSEEFEIDLSMVVNVPNRDVLASKEDKSSHIDLVQKGIESIKRGEAEKIVLSRKKIVSLKKFDILKLFSKLLRNNPNTFVYVWFHPVSGLWMGASPETFLSVTGNNFKTMALASTQKYLGSLEVKWNEKEKQEHQFVTDFIQSKFKNLNLKISKPFTKLAGNLLHICSEVKGKITAKNQLNLLIKTLHPTPAVCGLPKESSKEFIIKNENYNREYYTGFLGEMNENFDKKLFVNLRCMKIENNQAHIFVGGGITKGSDPEKEWEETVLKSEIMLSVI